jgi:hypothetical protein
MAREHEVLPTYVDDEPHVPVVNEESQARAYETAHATIDTHDPGWEGSTFARSEMKTVPLTPTPSDAGRVRTPTGGAREIRATRNPQAEHAALDPVKPRFLLGTALIFVGALSGGALVALALVFAVAALRGAPQGTAPTPTVLPETPPPAAAVRPPNADADAAGEVAAALSAVQVRSNRRVLVKVNGQPRDYSPVDLRLGPGVYAISAALPGKPASEKAVRVVVGAAAIKPIQFEF